PTNPIIDAVSCVSRGGDCRHAAPPFGGCAGPPSGNPLAAAAWGRQGEFHVPPASALSFPMRSVSVGFPTFGQTTDFAANPGAPNALGLVSGEGSLVQHTQKCGRTLSL